MVDRLRIHRADEAHVIRLARQVGQKLGVHHHAALAGGGELELRRRNREARLAAGHGGETLAIADAFRQVLVVPLMHLRLVVEEVDLRRAAHHVQVDHALCLGRKLRAGGKTAGSLARHGLAKQRCQSSASQEVLATGKKVAARFKLTEIVEGAHGRESYYLLSTSSKFIIWLQTMVQAANCAGLSLGSAVDSPTASRDFASAAWPW